MHSLAISEFTVKYCLTTADVLSWHLDCSTCKSLSLCDCNKSLFLGFQVSEKEWPATGMCVLIHET